MSVRMTNVRLDRAARRPIQSAQTLAMLRAMSARDPDPARRNPDTMARHFLPWRTRLTLMPPASLVRAVVEKIAPGGYYFAVARTRHFDRTLLESLRQGLEQLVILGAGYDSRAYRFADELRPVCVFELDFPSTQEQKKALLQQWLGTPPTHVRYVPIDFQREGLGAALAAHGYDEGRKSLFLWEGVSYYLSPPSVDQVLRFVSERSAPGSAIVFDYALRAFLRGDHRTYGSEAVARWLERIGEPFLFGLDPSETASFLRERGLSLVSDLSPEEQEDAYLASPRAPSRARVLGHVRMAWAVKP